MENLTKLKHLTKELSILYIESDLELQSKLIQYFSKFFNKVYQAFDGREGLKIYNQNKPDIILTDLDLKKKNAFEMIVDIQDINPNVKIIVLSNKNEDYTLLETLDLGINKLLTKPLNISDLNHEIINIFETHFNTNVCPQAQTILQNLSTNNPKITCINNFKGLILNHECQLLEYKNDKLTLKVSKTQLFSILYEKKVILSIDSNYILGKLLDVNIKNNTVSITNLKYIEYKLRSSKNKRIPVDKSFKTSIGYNNIHTELTPIAISYDYIVLETTIPLGITEKSIIELTIGFEIDGPSSFVKEKKFTKVFASGTIIRIDDLENKKRLIIELNIKKSGQNVFKKYLQQREIDIINEFKIKMKS